MSWLRLLCATLCATVLLQPAPLASQDTSEDYRRAAGMQERLRGLTINVAEAPTWIAGSNRFWYRKSVRAGFEVVLVDAGSAQQQPALDFLRHAGRGAALHVVVAEVTKP